MASKIYFLKNFNNYYNRIIKRFDTIKEYLDAAEDVAERGTSAVQNPYGKGHVNFNINDGITSTITYNYDETQEWQPDYVLVCDVDANPVTDRPKYSFFVMEAVKPRKGQYTITLRRDVIGDNYNNIINSPCFIEKATLPKSSPFIFNREDMTYNQIKSDNEILLKDPTGCGWVIGFMDNKLSSGGSGGVTFKREPEFDLSDDRTVAVVIADLESNKDKIIKDTSDTYYYFKAQGETTKSRFEYKLYMDGTVDRTIESLAGFTGYYREKYDGSKMKTTLKSSMTTNNLSNLTMNGLDYIFTGTRFISKSASQILLEKNDKIIKCTNGYVKVSVTTKSVSSRDTGDHRSQTTINSALNNVISSAFTINTSGSNSTTTLKLGSPLAIDIDVEELEDYGTCATGIPDDRRSLEDAPYAMFAIPYGNVNFKYTAANIANSIHTSDGSIAINAAIELMSKVTTYKIIDIQLVPYCPRLTAFKNNIFDLDALELGYDYNIIIDTPTLTSDSNVISFIMFCPTSRGTFDIRQSLEVPEDNIDFKIENETTFYRLSSPNYASQFEFKPTMNNGVDYFNVDYWYKPASPYIHINPNFKNLYGRDTDDARGLICAGDFSIPQITDQWVEYERNNINYQKSFDRQIRNMEVQQDIGMKQLGWQIAAGIAQGAVSGAVAGSAGGVGGSAVGALAGAGVSALGGAMDYKYQKELNAEAIDYTKDQFSFQLGNIKALPNTISNVGAYNNNNKIFPFLEKYTCTDSEKTALRNKLYYNGMSVGIIGSISEYQLDTPTYIKGKIIRQENLGDDFHMTIEIANELNKGVFI